MKFLAANLLTPSPAVRKSITSALDLMATLTTKDVTTLLEQHREDLFAPIFAQPFRKAHMKVQTGYMEALTYCLNLRPPLFPSFEGMNNL